MHVCYLGSAAKILLFATELKNEYETSISLWNRFEDPRYSNYENVYAHRSTTFKDLQELNFVPFRTPLLDHWDKLRVETVFC